MKKNGNAISVQLGAVPRDPNLGSIGILFRQKKKNRCQKVGRPLKPRRRPSCPATRPSHSRTSGRLIIISIRLKSIEIGPRYGWLPPYSTEAAHTHTHTHTRSASGSRIPSGSKRLATFAVAAKCFPDCIRSRAGHHAPLYEIFFLFCVCLGLRIRSYSPSFYFFPLFFKFHFGNSSCRFERSWPNSRND